MIVGLVVIMSVVLLVAKDLAIVHNTRFSTRLSRLLNIPILFMVAVFAVLLLLGVMEILQTGA